MDISRLVEAICREPIDRDYNTSPVGYYQALAGAGAEPLFVQVTADMLRAYLANHKDLIQHWVQQSEDQRCTEAWALMPNEGFFSSVWKVEYHAEGKVTRIKKFRDPAAATAFFVKEHFDLVTSLLDGKRKRS